jgi:hypothetical protein
LNYRDGEAVRPGVSDDDEGLMSDAIIVSL